jgi:hypothetical protein
MSLWKLQVAVDRTINVLDDNIVSPVVKVVTIVLGNACQVMILVQNAGVIRLVGY